MANNRLTGRILDFGSGTEDGIEFNLIAEWEECEMKRTVSAVSVIHAVCKVKDLKKFLEMGNRDVAEFGDITLLKLHEDCKRAGSVVIPYRGE